MGMSIYSRLVVGVESKKFLTKEARIQIGTQTINGVTKEIRVLENWIVFGNKEFLINEDCLYAETLEELELETFGDIDGDIECDHIIGMEIISTPDYEDREPWVALSQDLDCITGPYGKCTLVLRDNFGIPMEDINLYLLTDVSV